ncbi:MAG: putative PaaX family transcriptional regulator [Microgenomates group bacterium LiPW_31]|nr:MAG: putative PaaX family transcriptional regulator [Microgenomates group bacterium LiPW_31]
MLQDLVISKCRVKLLQTFLGQPNEIFYIRQLVRRIGEEINAVRRELDHLETAGIVKKENRGNRIYYWVDRNYPLYGDLLALISKTVGLGETIIKNKNKIGRIKIAMLSGRFARGLPTKEGAVDLLIVGDILIPELGKIIRNEETKVGKEINYTVMNKEEFEFRKKRRDPFLLGILTDSRIMLIGDELDLVG